MRELKEILDDIKTPIPAEWISTKKKGGAKLSFVSWYRVAEIADAYCIWEKEVLSVDWTPKHCYVKVRIWIHAKEGRFFRDGTGIEPISTNSFGDPQSNAESMAFRRAWANWGLARELYEKEDLPPIEASSGDGATTATPHLSKVELNTPATLEDAVEKLEKMKEWVHKKIGLGVDIMDVIRHARGRVHNLGHETAIKEAHAFLDEVKQNNTEVSA